MVVSASTEKLIRDISENSEKPVRNLFEVSVIIETSSVSGRQEEFKDLIFTAKYLNGLKNILSSGAVNNEEYRKNLTEEFNKNLQKLTGILKNIVLDSDEKVEEYFKNKYFLLNHESVSNTLSLMEDLSVCKEYFNANKVSI